MRDYLELPIGEQAPDVVTAVIEIRQGSINKYEYDKQLHVFRLDRNLHSSIQNYTDVMAHILREVEQFFSIYKDLEGKRTKVLGWKDRKSAHKIIRSSHARFDSSKARVVGSAIWE
jgi:inorganic pyrophosphatase